MFIKTKKKKENKLTRRKNLKRKIKKKSYHLTYASLGLWSLTKILLSVSKSRVGWPEGDGQ